MVVGSCHGVRRTKEGPGQAQNGVETLIHRAWVTHHHCPLALEQSVTGGAGINVNQKKKTIQYNTVDMSVTAAAALTVIVNTMQMCSHFASRIACAEKEGRTFSLA